MMEWVVREGRRGWGGGFWLGGCEVLGGRLFGLVGRRLEVDRSLNMLVRKQRDVHGKEECWTWVDSDMMVNC